MDKFYKLVNKINGCIANSDAKGLLPALQELWGWRDPESIEASNMFSVCIFNNLLLEHRELLNDPDLFDAWCTKGRNGLDYMGFSTNRGVFSRNYVTGRLLNSIFLGERENALDMLQKLEKAFIDNGLTFLEDERSIENYYHCIIDAAAEYDCPEILKHIAVRAGEIKDMEGMPKIPKHTGFLICRLIDKGYFDILDLMYEKAFDSVLVNMTHYIGSGIRKETKHSCVYYIRQLLKRYGKTETENENKSNKGGKEKSDLTPLYRLIEESDVIEGFFEMMTSYNITDDDLKNRILNELRKFAKIKYKTDNITSILNLWIMLTAPEGILGSWGGDPEQREIKILEIQRLIMRLIGSQPVYRALSVNIPFMFYTDQFNNVLSDAIKLFNVTISIDNIEKTDFYSEAEIASATEYSFSKGILKPFLTSDRIIMTDPVEENQFINYFIKRKSSSFKDIIKKLSLSKADLEALIPICTEYGNYNALNHLRKMLL